MRSQPFARLHDRTPIVLGGDFNDLYGTLGPKVLEPAGFRASGQPAATYPAIFPVRALDGLYVRGDLVCVRCARSRLQLTRDASDHLPLIADLELSWARCAALPRASEVLL
ncbi:MAG: endonuclease/exonuclease/phosphatase family protein, partial [Planctomycetota bacterium]